MIDLDAVNEKVKDSKGLGETKEKLTKEELVACMVREYETDQVLWVKDGDEYLILQILELLDEKKCSMRYAEYLLDMAKKMLPRICVFKL